MSDAERFRLVEEFFLKEIYLSSSLDVAAVQTCRNVMPTLHGRVLELLENRPDMSVGISLYRVLRQSVAWPLAR